MTDTPYTICVLGYGPHNMRLAQLFIEYGVHGVFYYDLTENVATVSEQMTQLMNMIKYGMDVGMLESKNHNFTIVPTIKRAIENGLENYFDNYPFNHYAKRHGYSHAVEPEKIMEAGFNSILVYYPEDAQYPASLDPDIILHNDSIDLERVADYIKDVDIAWEDDEQCVMRLITPSWSEESFKNFEKFLTYLAA